MKLLKAHQHKILFLCMTMIFISFVVMTRLTSGTFASFRSSEEEDNSFRVGDLTGVITETFSPPEDTELDDPISKIVQVKNEGNSPIFIRIMVLPEISVTNSTGDSELLPASIGKEVLLLTSSGTEISDGVDWINGGDGYYYYLHALAPDESTVSALFEGVKLDSSITAKDYDGANFKIEVKLESINTTKWSYRDAWWNGDSLRWATGTKLKAVDDKLLLEVTN